MPIITTIRELKPRRAADFYPTPHWVVEIAMNELHAAPISILDTGAGEGIWGEVAREKWGSHPFIVGIDSRPLPQPTSYSIWLTGDYHTHEELQSPAPPFDLIMGNPPYLLAEQFIRHSLSLLAPHGILVYLLRLSFLESKGRGDGLWLEHPPKRVIVLKSRPSFTGDNKTDSDAYALYYWQQGWVGDTTLAWAGKPEQDTGQMKLLGL